MHPILLFIQLAIVAADESTEEGTFLTAEDFARGKSLPEVQPVDRFKLYSEDAPAGDIIPDSPKLRVSGADRTTERKKRNIVKAMAERWTGGVVPYEISRRFNDTEKAHIAQAITTITDSSCVKFEERNPSESSYIFFQQGDHAECSSKLGRRGGKQPLILGELCSQKGIIVHELMHALGFIHEQSRPDRDDHVIVFDANVKERSKENFRKYRKDEVDMVGAYDYDSIMHYGLYDYGKPFEGLQYLWFGSWYPNQMTMYPRKEGVTIGQAIGLSKGDIEKLNTVYPCPNDPKTTPSPASDCRDKVVRECRGLTAGNCNATMAALCKKTCDLCGVCRDREIYCDKIHKSGACYLQWAADICQQTCGYCPECYDQDVNGCENAMKNSECTKREKRRRCARSCGLCRGCRDTAAQGICESAKTRGCADPATRRGCQKSCGLCEDCKDKATFGCADTAAAGLCDASIINGDENCRQSCGYCTKHSKAYCEKNYVGDGNTADGACSEKLVRDGCPRMCKELPPGPFSLNNDRTADETAK